MNFDSAAEKERPGAGAICAIKHVRAAWKGSGLPWHQTCQTKPTIPNLSNQPYQINPTKPSLPQQTYQAKLNLANQAYQTKPKLQNSSRRLGPKWLWQCFNMNKAYCQFKRSHHFPADLMSHSWWLDSELGVDLAKLYHFSFDQQNKILAWHRNIPTTRVVCFWVWCQWPWRELPHIWSSFSLLPLVHSWHSACLAPIFASPLWSSASWDAWCTAHFPRWLCRAAPGSPGTNFDQESFLNTYLTIQYTLLTV